MNGARFTDDAPGTLGVKLTPHGIRQVSERAELSPGCVTRVLDALLCEGYIIGLSDQVIATDPLAQLALAMPGVIESFRGIAVGVLRIGASFEKLAGIKPEGASGHAMGEEGLYRRRVVISMTPWHADYPMEGVLVEALDTPGPGGMIAHDPANPGYRWYVAVDELRDLYVPA